MPHLHTGKDCSGCTACYAVCPKTAITMKADPLGFKYPEVDYNKCIECKLCEKVCPFKEDYATPDNLSGPIPVGVRLKEMKEMMKSRSGGAFKAISDYVLRNEGVVYGVGVDEDMKILHIRATDSDMRDRLRGSKYVQSDMGDTLRNLLADLKAGKMVLFSGTACQTAGAASYIPAPLRKNLILVDIVCHGVPSPAVWSDYVDYVEKKEESRMVAINFRDKEKYGWHAQYETMTFENGNVVSSRTFAHLFTQDIMIRPSCAICHFANLRRPADLTLADFWGVEKSFPEFNADDKGASLLLLNTPKGEEIWNCIKEECNYVEPSIEQSLQPNLLRPSARNPKSEKFARDYEKKGFGYIISHYSIDGLKFRLLHRGAKLKRLLLSPFKK